MTGISLTPDQFDALAALMRLRDSPTAQGARMVLVDGLGVTAAARAVGVQRGTINQCLQACRRGIELARRLS